MLKRCTDEMRKIKSRERERERERERKRERENTGLHQVAYM